MFRHFFGLCVQGLTYRNRLIGVEALFPSFIAAISIGGCYVREGGINDHFITNSTRFAVTFKGPSGDVERKSA
ncbi:hypothetical protein RB2150_13601 [Rhodobacteraceae bacterium HTCC2150]|nr:hypothetical protein RB2150_13601 [Rhodobacteraceae bacterium HTCC2150]